MDVAISGHHLKKKHNYNEINITTIMIMNHILRIKVAIP